jgi:hypothetical protein
MSDGTEHLPMLCRSAVAHKQELHEVLHMKMKQIQSAIAEAPKLQGIGKLKYRIWVDGEGNLYVQIEDNAGAGTFSDMLFSVSKYAPVRKSPELIDRPIGYDISRNEHRSSANTNDSGFLKAVLCHLLPE